MPEMDGFEATRNIRDFDEKVPIIAVTANALSGDAERCLESGMNAHLAKPFTKEQLVNLMLLYVPADKAFPVSKGWEPQMPNKAEEPDAVVEVPTQVAGLEDCTTFDLDQLKDQVGDSEEMLLHILTKYLTTQQADMEALQNALTSCDLPGVRKIAHRMKGAASMIGAKDLAELCLSIEKEHEEGLDTIKEKYEQLNKKTAAIKREVESLSGI